MLGLLVALLTQTQNHPNQASPLVSLSPSF
jgi:hypothetical protein